MDEVDVGEVLDDETWSRRERFWRDVVDAILESIGPSGEWPSWEPKFLGDGTTPIPREWQSICDGRSWRLDRAFSIDERPSTDGNPTISAWVKDYVVGLMDFRDIDDLDDANRWFEQTHARDRVPRSTLMIFTEESEATDDAARSLLEMWFKPATTVQEMERVISQRLG